MRGTNRELLHIFPYPRRMLNIARPADAALLANLGDRLDDCDMSAASSTNSASRFPAHVYNGGILLKGMDVQPTAPATCSIRTGHDEAQCGQIESPWSHLLLGPRHLAR
jgi:hypothetical protein